MTLVESFSGIRGIYGSEFTLEVAKKYGFCFLNFLKQKNENPTIVIGRDTRLSGEDIFQALVGVLNCNVINVGIQSTPTIENAVRAFNVDGGIIISASHNEPEFNGLKILDKDGAVLRAKDIEKIINDVKNVKSLREGKAQVVNMEKESLDKYKEFLKTIVKESEIKEVPILIDANGGAGVISKEIFEDYGLDFDYLNMDKGVFKRLIEPNDKSLAYLKDYIKKYDSEFAVGFDCDADRAEILLKDGTLVSGNDILALIAEEILSSNKEKDKTIVVNDATSYSVKKVAQRHSARFIEVEVGEINVVDEMINKGAVLGGEGSNGGVIVPPSRCRDGILVVLLLLKILNKKKISLNDLIKEVPKRYYVKEKIILSKNFYNIRDKVKQYYRDNNFTARETGLGDGGLKFIKEGSWIWFRQSKTESGVLRVISDADEPSIAMNMIQEAKSLLKEISG